MSGPRSRRRRLDPDWRCFLVRVAGRSAAAGTNINSFPTATAIWDPESGSWSAGGNSLDLNSEEGWTLLPDATVLAVQCVDIPNAQKYVIATKQWVSAGNTGATLRETGHVPPVSMRWARRSCCRTAASSPLAPADIPRSIRRHTVPTDPGHLGARPGLPWAGAASDGRGRRARLPSAERQCTLRRRSDRRCRVVGSVGVLRVQPATLALIPVPGPAIAGTEPYVQLSACCCCRLDRSALSPPRTVARYDLQIYTPAGGPQPGWRPHITHVPRHLHPGRTYRLHGRQLNGLSQACAYGDDQQMATNYPLVRLWGRPGVGAVYCRTFDHSTMGVATGKAIHHTHFEVPEHLPHGEYRLVVIANGIASHPVEVRVEHDEHRRHHDDDHDHDEEIVEFDHEEAKYKDKDAKEAKEKEKDLRM